MSRKRSSIKVPSVRQRAPIVTVELSAYPERISPISILELQISGSKLKGSSHRKIEALWKTFSEEVLALT